jgi:hypothetical protein
VTNSDRQEAKRTSKTRRNVANDAGLVDAGAYAVGYGKPPKSTRFQKGTSGNPGGRPKKSLQPFDLALVLEKIENEEMIVVNKGKRKSLRKAEVYFQRLFAKAIEGNLAAAKLLVNMAEEQFAVNAPGVDLRCEYLSETQARQRFGKNWIKKINELNAPLIGADGQQL